MAEFVLGLAKSTVEGTLTMAKSAIEEETKLRSTVQRDLVLLSDEFEMMHSVLNVAKDPGTDDVTRTLLRQVRNMALDAEDCIESVLHLDGKSNWWRHMLPSCVLAAAPASDLDAAVADLELLKARVEGLGHRSLRYSRIGDSGPKQPAEQTKQQPPANATASNILVMGSNATEQQGRRDLVMLITKEETSPRPREKAAAEQEKGKQVANEFEAEQQVESPLYPSAISEAGALRVISVFGSRYDLGMMAIKKAYHDSETCNSFRCRAWMKLMHPFNPCEFIRTLLSQFYKNYCPEQDNGTVDLLEPTELMVATEGVLIEEFKRQMRNYRYLIVLEDVSTIVDWEAARVYLPQNNDGSCIIVHTQQLGIASLCVGHPHRVLELEKISTQHSVYVLFKEGEAEKVEETVPNKAKTAREWLHENQLVGHQEIRSGGLSYVYDSCVVSVWGMSGVGISFLVRHFYYQHQYQTSYPSYRFGWVNVAYPFDLMDLSRSLLLDFDPGYHQHLMKPVIEDPILGCREHQHKHECYIVIDGLQSMDDWDLTKAALQLGTLRGTIVVITNEESIAKHCASSNHVYNPTGLDDHHASELLEKKQSTDLLLQELNQMKD